MNRIAVLGNSGGGKTRLSLTLSDHLGLPYHSMDKLQWGPHWIPVPLAEQEKTHDHWLAQGRWIIDGLGHDSMMEKRLRAADTLVLIELELWRHCWWAMKRQVVGIFRPRSDGPEGCALLPRSWQLAKAIRWGYRLGIPSLKKRIAEIGREMPEKRVIWLKSPEDITRFAREVGAEGGLLNSQ